MVSSIPFSSISSHSRSAGFHSPSVTPQVNLKVSGSITVHPLSSSAGLGALSPTVDEVTASPALPSSLTSSKMSVKVLTVGSFSGATTSPTSSATAATVPTSVAGQPPQFTGTPANSTTPVFAPTQDSKSSVHIVQSVTVVTPTITSTTTEFPASTFSTPVAVTTVLDNTTSVGTPAFVTLLSTSTNSNGSAITWTRVLANPTGVALAKPTSFLQNTGAAAGVFVIVGIISACLLLCVLYFIRRFHRTRRQDRWLQTLQSLHNGRGPNTKVPFHDHESGTVVRSLSLESTSVGDNSRIIHPAYDTVPVYLRKESRRTGASQKSRPWSTEPESPFRDIHAYRQIPTVIDHLKPLAQEVSPQSTPSIYPVTLEGEDEKAAEQPAERNEAKIHVAAEERPRTAEAPPRPPRSALRSLSRPSTAPESSSSTSRKDIHAILQRQTLLDVRPRSSRPSSGTSYVT